MSTEYPVWAESTKGDNQPDQRRINQARADLAVLPDLIDELTRCLTERVPIDGGGTRGKPGSRPPLRLEVLHLVDQRRKPGWDGEDPRLKRWLLTWRENGQKMAAETNVRTRLFSTEDAAWNARELLTWREQDSAKITPWSVRDAYGALATLESWTRVLVEEMAEPPELAERATVRTEVAVLVECWDWVSEQDWAEELADDVLSMTAQVRAALGIRKEPRYVCPTPGCGDRAFISNDFLVCASGHEKSVRNLDMQERRKPAMPTSEICKEFDITPAQLWQWNKRNKVKPTEVQDYRGREKMWLPWDIFSVLNPDLAAAFDAREDLEAG